MSKYFTQHLKEEVIRNLEKQFNLPDFQFCVEEKKMTTVLNEVQARLSDNYPYFHPLYVGQMLKPPHPIALAAYQLAMWINPNNHALDGGKASSEMEKEAVADLAKLVGWTEHLGHLTGGGTVANLEALWVASKEKPHLSILASDQAHYTHRRMCELLNVPFEVVPSTCEGRMDVEALEKQLQNGGVGTVVVTLGTTGLGMVDPLDEIALLQKKYSFRIHVDAAYGGYFKLSTQISQRVLSAFEKMECANSIVIDPHKHGLQPYGCGCVLFQNPEVAKYYLHDSPYTYFTSSSLHLGEISLECSRPGASAVGLWATHQLLPLVRDGAFAKSLDACRKAALIFTKLIQKEKRLQLVNNPDLDIVVWYKKSKKISEITEESHRIFSEAAKQNVHLSKISIPSSQIKDDRVHKDESSAICLRTCFMKPQHLDWVDTLWEIIEKII